MNIKTVLVILILIGALIFGYFVWPIPHLSTQMHDDFLKEDNTQELISGKTELEGKRGESYIKYVDKTKEFIENINKEQQIYMDKVD